MFGRFVSNALSNIGVCQCPTTTLDATKKHHAEIAVAPVSTTAITSNAPVLTNVLSRRPSTYRIRSMLREDSMIASAIVVNTEAEHSDDECAIEFTPIAEEYEPAVSMPTCPCGDVCTPTEAILQLESAVGELVDRHVPMVPYEYGIDTSARLRDASRVFYAIGRLNGAIRGVQYVSVARDDQFVRLLSRMHTETGCTCDRVLCAAQKCCRDDAN